MYQVTKIGISLLLLLTLAGCRSASLEEKFFEPPLVDATQRMANYSLQDQYKIFRYGNDVVQPPLIELARPIAARGSSAIPFLISELRTEKEDIGIRDLTLLFSTFAEMKTYNVRCNFELMKLLEQKVHSVDSWGSSTSEMFNSIKFVAPCEKNQ